MNTYPVTNSNGVLIGRISLTEEVSENILKMELGLDLHYEYKKNDRILSFQISPKPVTRG